MHSIDLCLKDGARDLLTRLGSAHVHKLGYRDMWSMVTVNTGSGAITEGHAQSAGFPKWASPVMITANITPSQGQ